MPKAIDLSTLTLGPELVDKASQIAFRSAFAESNITDLHRIYTGITHGQDIAFLSEQDGATGVAPGDCGVPETGIARSPVSLRWTPYNTASRNTLCRKNLVAVQNKFIGSLNGVNAEQTSEHNYLLNLLAFIIRKEISKSIHYKTWFADPDAEAYTIGGGGEFSNGGTEAQVKQIASMSEISGLFKQFKALPSTSLLNIQDVNGLDTPQTITPARCLEIVHTMHADMASGMLRSATDTDAPKRFLVSRSIFEGLQSVADSTANILTYSVKTAVFGQGVSVSYKGIEVVCLEALSEYINSYKVFNTAASGAPVMRRAYPHFAILSTKDNLPVALGSSDQLNTLEVIKDEPRYEVHLDWSVQYDAKVLDPKMIVVAM